MSESGRNEDYNSEPLKYCAKCLSLKIKYEESVDSEYCAECGSSDILEAPVEEWEKKYENKYKRKFVVKEEDPKKSFIFRLPLKELKTKVYESTKWKEILKAMYPSFPEGYSKADSIILFFDTLIKQNKIDEFKLLLYKHFKH